jgi:hypothetical protein
MSLLVGESFTNFWFQFELVLKVFQKVSNKNRKREKAKDQKKKGAAGQSFGPSREAAHDPISLPPELVSFSLSSCR